MKRTREFQIAAFAFRRGRVVVLTFCRAVKELISYRRGVCVPFTDTHRIAGVVNMLLCNEYSFKSSHCIQQRAYGHGQVMSLQKIGRASRDIDGMEVISMYL
jgi:hypothetical protein